MSGFEVQVETRYIAGESDPASDRYVFAYTITITNRGDSPGQLMTRHWYVTDATGHVQEVEGPGVVGRQPRIEPDEAFRYTSGAALATPVGSMHGAYHFRRDDGTPFEVPIPPFSLSMPNLVH